MTKRFLATSVSVIALSLTGAASPGVSGEIARDQSAPFTVAAVQNAAPNFAGISKWFNSAPLNIADLRGKVVLVDFWTYGCVNCINTLPHVTELYGKYRDRGLVVVGVHTPEFPFERSASNVQTALKRHGITYPVAQDNDSQTWDAYHNEYWPAQYIVDQSGKIVYQHEGEGQYEQIDRTIARLLNASSSAPPQTARINVAFRMLNLRPGTTVTDGADVRGLGCRWFGPGAVRIHDVISHRVSRLLDRTCKLPRGARGAVAVDRAPSLHQPVQLLAQDLRGRVRHGRGVGNRDVLPVRHQLGRIFRQSRPCYWPVDGL
jgi:thiol-disulfide isomerase/thioredoxin